MIHITVAAITPRGDEGEIDFGAVFELIDYLCAAGAQRILLFGAPGEYPMLATEERARLLNLAVKRSRVPVIAGVGSGSLDASVFLAREARAAGAESLMLPPPYFFPYGQDDIREFYVRFASRLGPGGPVLISNTPRFTTAIEIETAGELLGGGMFAGMEDSSGDADYFGRLQATARASGLGALAGNDLLFRQAACGAGQAVSAVACACPELMTALALAMETQDPEASGRLDAWLVEFLRWMAEFPEPVALKAATAMRGIKTGPLLVPLSPAKQQKLDEFREWFRGMLNAVVRRSANG